MTRQVLIIDDDPVQRRLVEALVMRMGHRPLLRDSVSGGIEALRQEGSDAIAALVLDLMLSGESGLDVLADMQRQGRDIPVIVLTSRSGIDTVVEAMRAGAFDFVVKPVSPERLQQTIDKAIRVHDARRRGGPGARPKGARAPSPPTGRAMRDLLALAERAAGSTIPLLIEGETGTGKEWLADTIRAAGPRAEAPFVIVNCGAMPTGLAESILFGHERGAFTDAGERRPGKFVDADGGTLFLDEIGELPLEIQVKLLRVLQSGEVDPVGGRRPVRPDVRIIAATHRHLPTEVAAGRFREDLYYRLNVLSVRLPPLRERRDEIAPLAAHFLARFAEAEPGSPARHLSAEAVTLLERHDWPGNIRQLENALHRAVVLADGPTLGIADFPQIGALQPGGIEAAPVPARDGTEAPAGGAEPVAMAVRQPFERESTAAPDGFGEDGELLTLEAVEAAHIRRAVAHYGGHMSEIARRLGIGRSTLYRKMRLYGIFEADAGFDKDKHQQTLRDTGDA